MKNYYKFNLKLIIMKNRNVFLLLMFFAFLISCSDSDDDSIIIIEEIDKIITTEDLIDIYTGEKRGTSTLTRDDGKISFKIETSNLIPGHVYQIMCGIWNKPQNCVGPCDGPDWYDNIVEAVSFVMPGKTINNTSATFEGTLKENDITSYSLVANQNSPANGWGGLQDALTARITLDVRSKGPAQAGVQQFHSTWSTGCTYIITNPYNSTRVPEEIGECAFIQLSTHDAP